MNQVKIGLCQMKVGANKKENLKQALKGIGTVAAKGAQIVLLPEMFNCPYDQAYFRDFAEEIPGGETERALAETARRHAIYLIGGSIPEIDQEGKVYNTSLVMNPHGEIIGKHRKVHLFDIRVKEGIQFQESASLTAGNRLTLADTPWGKIGIMICYDIRFPELARLMANAGAKMIFVPGAFNMTTGPAHWELLFRSRALDNQIYMLGCSPARNLAASYVAYGHSLVAGPWGNVIGMMEEAEDYRVIDLDLTEIDKVRQGLPVWEHRRKDLYDIVLTEHGRE